MDDEQPDGERAAGEMPADRMSDDKMSAQIDDLDARIARLGAYIDARHDELAVGDLCRLLDLHSMMLSRVTRMRQVQNALNGEQTRFMALLYRVLDIILEERGMRREPARRVSIRRVQGRASQPWVQGRLRFAPEG